MLHITYQEAARFWLVALCDPQSAKKRSFASSN